MDYGRNRDSLTDIEDRLTQVFESLSSSTVKSGGTLALPATELPKILSEYSKRHGTQLLSQDGERTVQQFLDTHPDIEFTPTLTIQLIAGLTSTAPPENAPSTPPKDDPSESRSDGSDASSPDTSLRAHGGGDNSFPTQTLSRQSSDSSFHGALAPTTPLSSGRIASSSPFDSTARQRSTPLASSGPSAWGRKPLPASRRRKSDAGSVGGNRSSSDNEQSSPAIVRGPRRSRAPSNPVSPNQEAFPTSTSAPLSSDTALLSPPRRSQSFDQSTGMSQTLVDPDLSYKKSKKSPLLKFHSSESSSESEPDGGSDEDQTRRYVRQPLSSDASLAPEDVLEGLQKAHAELMRRSSENDKRMQNRLAERETEIAHLENLLDDLKTQLSLSRRDEKELRTKERANMSQFSTFESEIQKLQKSLDHARSQYSSMQKQYQEQCTETERMRNLLRKKEQELKEADDRAYTHEGEVQKWAREREALETSIGSLEVELNMTRQAMHELEEQKQENLLLKETIDRMRFDLDALRAGMGPSAAQEGPGTLSRSFANEIKAKFERQEKEREQDEADEADEIIEHHDGEESGDEYVTTVTTSRKRVGARTKSAPRLDSGLYREYIDAGTQHDESEFHSATGVQHDQPMSESGVQHQPSEFSAAAEVQTEAKVLHDMQTETELPRVQDAETETEPPHVQDAGMETEAKEVKHAESGTEAPEVKEAQTEAQAGVEQAVGPDEVIEVVHVEVGTETGPKMCEMEVQTDPEPTQTPHAPAIVTHDVPIPADLPPPYPHAAESGVLKRWHARRAHRVPESIHAREEWAALKRLIGVECQVIERAVEGQNVDDFVEDKDDEAEEPEPSRARKLFRISFEFTSWPYLLTHAVMGFGVWSLAAAVVVNQLVPHTPTYTDRMNWSAYNNYAGALGEGLVGRPGESALWTALERLVLGAAVRVGPGLPT